MLLAFHCCGYTWVIPGHNLGNSQVSVNRTIGPTLVSKNLRTFCCSPKSIFDRLVTHFLHVIFVYMYLLLLHFMFPGENKELIGFLYLLKT